MSARWTEHFHDLSNWSQHDFSLDANGWAYCLGNADGYSLAERPRPADCVYAEALVYADATTNFHGALFKFDSNGANGLHVYDFDGCAVVVNSFNGQIGVVGGPTVSWTAPGWTGSVATPPRSIATAVLVGIAKVGGAIGAGIYDVYVNRQRVRQYTGLQGGTGTNIGLASESATGAHFTNVAVYDHVPGVFDEFTGPAAMVY